MLSMRYNKKHICGAVIIGKTWSLTAAHCCIKYRGKGIKMLSMQSGSAKLYKDGTLHQVTRIVRNEDYRDNDDVNDICAVQVSPPFPYKENQPHNLVLSVKLPELGVPYDKSWGLVTGWGYNKADGTALSPMLQSINVTIINLDECKYRYRNSYTVHNHNVCYGTESILMDVCQGDSGGPLVNNDSILIGIVSFGYDCGYSNLPGVYTDVIQFRKWIKRTTGL